MLHCEFPLGRRGDAEFQHRVLDRAFGLLVRTDVPVLADFPEVIEDRGGEPLSCGMPPRRDPTLHPAVQEAIALRPAYDRAVARGGRTGVFRTGGPDGIAGLLTAFVAIAGGAPWQEPAFDLAAAAGDIRAYYEEAALGLSDHMPAARQAESWLYRTTATGRLLIDTRNTLRAAEAPRRTWAAFVPGGQP